MKTVRYCAIPGFYIAVFTIGLVRSASGAPGDVNTPETNSVDHWDLFVADQQTYDSNIYRLPSTANADSVISPNSSREDHINTASVGVDALWAFGRQALALDLRLDENRFLRNDSLNNTATSDKLVWNWRIGSALTGQVGVDYGRSLASFAETLYLGKDLVESKEYFGLARYQLGPRWALFGGLDKSDGTHSAPVAQYNDLQSKSGNAGIEYALGLTDTVSWEYRYTTGGYPKGYVLNNELFNRNYHETTTRVFLKYALTGKTVLDASAGYLKHDYPNENTGAYSGDIWRVSLQWQPTEKSQVTLSGWHELHNYLYSQADYFVSKGVSIALNWIATEKLTFSLSTSTEDQSFIGLSQSVLILGSRQDKLIAQQATVVYKPIEALVVNFFLRREHRESNQVEFQYDDTLAHANITFKF